jgi:hypothetical protein
MPNSIRKRDSLSWLSFVSQPTARVLVFAFICVLATPFNCLCANCISVRVLDAKSGKPIKSVPAFVETERKLMIRLGETDGQGVVRFCPDDPVPASFTLEFKYVHQADAEVHFDMESVLKTGSVAKNAQNKGKFHDREIPKPAEIVVFGKRWWPIDRWLDKRLGEWP